MCVVLMREIPYIYLLQDNQTGRLALFCYSVFNRVFIWGNKQHHFLDINRNKMKSMKKLTFIAILAGFFLPVVSAQDYVPTKADIEKFFKTKTLVVLEDNPLMEYNIVIQEIMKKEWTITPFEVIPYKEFEAKRKDPNYSFLMLVETRFERDKTEATYKFLDLLLGGNYFRINEMPALAQVPLAYEEVEEHSYIYKLGTLVRFMQNHIKLMYEKPEIISSNIFKYYNDNIADIKNKVLYVTEEDLAPQVNSEKRIKSVYPYKVRITTQDEIEKAIQDKDPDVVFLHKVGPEGTRLKARCYKVIIGAADAQFYYFDYHMINDKRPDGFLESDFKKLAKK